MSPLAIQIMLHCYCSNEPWDNVLPRIWSSPAGNKVRRELFDLGLIDTDLCATESGKQFVQALLSVSSAICRNANAGVTAPERASVSTMP